MSQWSGIWRVDVYFWEYTGLFLSDFNSLKRLALKRWQLFSKAEWWYHWLMMPVLVPLGNYYFIGLPYFKDLLLFIIGTDLGCVLYWASIASMTLAVKKIMHYWPGEINIGFRTFVTFATLGILTVGWAIFDVWAYSQMPVLNVPFSWKAVKSIWILGGVFDLFLCVALLLFGSDVVWPIIHPKAENPEFTQNSLKDPVLSRLRITPLEWGFHGLAVLVFIPVANHLLIGSRYWTNPEVLGVGSTVITLLYLPIALLLTVSVRVAIHCYPTLKYTALRIGLMISLTGVVSSLSAIGSVWVLSKIDVLGVTFTNDSLITLVLLGLLFDVLFCIAHGYFYALSMWNQQKIEIEKLKKDTLQHQFDALKGQLNPHFLFNSLNSLSSLISEDTEQAERFVDDLAKVYRYLLQVGRPADNALTPHAGELVSLQAELTFISSYIRLLQTRYGESLQIEQAVDEAYRTASLPPLTLQTLIDNAMQHNTMHPSKPLQIAITTTTDGNLKVCNNIQRKKIWVENSLMGLSELMAKYQMVGDAKPLIYENESHFEVTVPLLEAIRHG